jgi:hypothetical protein
MITSDKFKKIGHDINGNPRYVVHFLDLTTEEEGATVDVLPLFELVAKRNRKIGVSKYRGQRYGGGMLVFTSFNVEATARVMNDLNQLHPVMGNFDENGDTI